MKTLLQVLHTNLNKNNGCISRFLQPHLYIAMVSIVYYSNYMGGFAQFGLNRFKRGKK